ncbi:hypothetical protein [Leucobacter triazinivorans]|uniref:Uncharacterized protein n=1 Tax=Leucobacter triazinivorans TaxID=1784719 RepID=A0A4V0Z1C8_9MICO|nr:hypothetical protein [Leucobacter triazinivorans]QBE47959.1 hypothetical protein EVS81_03235 [Leucobacter triazinivorans]
MRKSLRTIAITATAAAALALAGCSGAPPITPESPDAERTPITVGVMPVVDVAQVYLGDQRDQLGARADAEFASLRTHVYELVQAAKKGARTVEEAHLARG